MFKQILFGKTLKFKSYLGLTAELIGGQIIESTIIKPPQGRFYQSGLKKLCFFFPVFEYSSCSLRKYSVILSGKK